MNFKKIGVAFIFIGISACSGKFSTLQSSLTNGAESNLISKDLDICSDLSVDGMVRPQDYSHADINAFILALNISGSFEGHEQWRNITNNFDGTGLSLGLLNQTLGTGSLQPLLVEMMETENSAMKNYFSTADNASLENMLRTWKSDSGITLKSSPTLFAPNGQKISDLDKSLPKIFAQSPEDKSVTWALNTIYQSTDGMKFKPQWKAEFQNMAESVEYRTIQFDAAKFLHAKARHYQQVFGFKKLKSYLFLIDMVVQNGGFYQSNLDDFNNFTEKNKQATEEEKLQALLTSRLKQVLDQWKDDVRARKQSIIDGHGNVHGENRNYESEYCFLKDTTYAN